MAKQVQKKWNRKVSMPDLINEVIEDLGDRVPTDFTKAQVSEIIRTTFERITTNLIAHDAIMVHNMFMLEPVFKQRRLGRNPRKPEETVDIPARWTVRMKLGKILKENLNRD